MARGHIRYEHVHLWVGVDGRDDARPTWRGVAEVKVSFSWSA